MLSGLRTFRSDSVVIEDSSRKVTGRELTDRVTRLARSFRDEFDLEPGDHMAMIVGNRVEFIEIVLAAMCSGVWITPVSWHLTASEVEYIIDDADVRLLVVDPAFVDIRPSDSKDHPALLLGEPFESMIADADDRPIEAGEPAGATMPYTSGTTGYPKGVRRFVHPRLDEQIRSLVEGGRLLGLNGEGAHLVTGPLYHAAPGGFALRDLLAGAKVVLMDRWNSEEALRLIEDHDVSHTHMVPTMFNRLLSLPQKARESFDPTALRTVLHGAAPIAETTKRQMIEWWGPVFYEYWGASEGGVVTLIDSREWLEHPGSVGKPIAFHEVFALDEAGRRLSPGETGLLWVRNTGIEPVFEYHDDPEKTAAAFRGPDTYTLGDIGSVDAEGFVSLTDRVASTIISGGVNIYPAEVEKALAGHPAVADVAVFGVPDDDWGETVSAAIELSDGFAPSSELAGAILEYGRRSLAGYKVPRSLVFVADIPRTPSGKLARTAMLERLLMERASSAVGQVGQKSGAGTTHGVPADE